MTPFFLLICCANAASFPYYQLSQKDPEHRLKNIQRMPNLEMIKALEYIENLRQQVNQEDGTPDYNPYHNAPFVLQPNAKDDQGQLEENVKDSTSEDEPQWVRAMLQALMQAEKEGNMGSKANKKPYPIISDRNIQTEMSEDYETNKWPEKRHKIAKMPLRHYEDGSKDNPFKRTNEIVEEQYTPQSLATLESVFKELGKFSMPSNHKRERLEDDQKLYKDDEDDLYKANNIAYEDVVGGEDWNPVEEKVESQTEEDIKDSKEEIEQSDDEIDNTVKKSQQYGFPKDTIKDNKEKASENIARLTNYYMKMLMLKNRIDNGPSRTAQNEEERGAAYLEKDLDPQAIFQLIEMSKNLQIPPEDLLDMLKSGDKKQGEKNQPNQEPEVPGDLDEVTDPTLEQTDIFRNRINSKNGYINQPASLPEELTFEDVANLLAANNVPNQKPRYVFNQLTQDNGLQRSPYAARRQKGHKPVWMNDLDRRNLDYDQMTDDDEELTDYLTKVLTKYPEVMNTNQMKRVPTEDDLDEENQYEQIMKEYFNPAGSQEFGTVNKRLSNLRDNGDTHNRQYVDEDMLMKVLEYLNQDKTEQGRNPNVKRDVENM
ncbi:secretogranin-2 [Ambystoma mexicanum]|uniref:secretogranin-2 n=1 Tax=Ambystoma mexicanum TaxID=8296 RepID=UPI0037E7CEE1